MLFPQNRCKTGMIEHLILAGIAKEEFRCGRVLVHQPKLKLPKTKKSWWGAKLAKTLIRDTADCKKRDDKHDLKIKKLSLTKKNNFDYGDKHDAKLRSFCLWKIKFWLQRYTRKFWAKFDPINNNILLLCTKSSFLEPNLVSF